MTNFLLNIKNLCLTHSNNLMQKADDFTLQNISFQLPNHSSISILGESATGKSSLIMALMKLHPIDSGEILYKNRSIYRFSKKETIAYQQNIQPVFQNYDDSLNPKLKILKSLTLGMNSDFSQQKRNKKIRQLLDLTELDETILHKHPHQLSGGEKQRVTIARALVTNPEIIILDEPFSSLDVLNQEKLLKVLKKMQSELNLSYIFITHKIPLVKHFQDKIYLLQNSEMLQFDTYEDLIKTVSYDD